MLKNRSGESKIRFFVPFDDCLCPQRRRDTHDCRLGRLIGSSGANYPTFGRFEVTVSNQVGEMDSVKLDQFRIQPLQWRGLSGAKPDPQNKFSHVTIMWVGLYARHSIPEERARPAYRFSWAST